MADKKEPYNPIVPVEGEPQPEPEKKKTSGSGLALANIGGNKMIIVGISIFFSVVIYFLMFSGGDKKDAVDNRDIVQSTNKTSTISDQDRKIIDSLQDLDLTYNDFSDSAGMNDIETNRELLELPTIPALPEEVKENIEEGIKQEKQDKKNEEVYSKEDVDKLINEKLKSFEEEIKRAKDESERLAKEVERQKILEEEEEKKRQKGGIIANILNAPEGGTTANGEEDDPFADSMTEEEKKQREEEEKQMRMQQRARVIEERKSASMFKMQGGGPQEEKAVDNDSIIVTNKDLLNKVADTKINVETTKAADLSRTILQGKLIQAILETSIDTDVQAQVRAVVTRDIYSESEKNILIPRGSKLIGAFRSDTIQTGVARINISWNRIVRTDGLSINISANSADNLGRGGVGGDLDNKYAQAIQNSLLSSVVSIGTALLTEKISGSVGITSTTNDSGNTTSSGKASDYAIVDATENFSKDMKDLVDKLKVSNPTLRIAQGTKLNVVVNQDLQLPIFRQHR